MTRTIAVYGIGNVLIGDDAVGPTIVHHLSSLYEFPPNVIIEDLGTPSLDLAARLAGTDIVVFVDAVSAKGSRGEIRTYTREEILRHPPGLRLSPHDPSLKETLLTLDLMSDAPTEIMLIGIIPETLEQFGLSETVRAAIPRAIDQILGYLESLGIHATRRHGGSIPTMFWDAA
jgi:hydrogenase maturation protease